MLKNYLKGIEGKMINTLPDGAVFNRRYCRESVNLFICLK